MSKAILVIDMPNSCDECFSCCDSWNEDGQVFGVCSVLKNKNIEEFCKAKTKPDWCPLKEMPEKMEGDNSIKYQWGDYEDGWNHCLEEILGGNKC